METASAMRGINVVLQHSEYLASTGGCVSRAVNQTGAVVSMPSGVAVHQAMTVVSMPPWVALHKEQSVVSTAL